MCFSTRDILQLGFVPLLIFMALIPKVAMSQETPKEPSNPQALLKAVPGTKIKLDCETNAVGMDFNPFKTTSGTVTFVLSFQKAAQKKTSSDKKPDEASGTDGNASKADGSTPARDEAHKSDAPINAPDPSVLGTWTASVEPGKHEASLGVSVEKLCAQGCVLRETPSGNMELWSPRPIMPSKLADDERLSIVTIDVNNLAIKATSFLGQQLSILEKGQCKIDKP